MRDRGGATARTTPQDDELMTLAQVLRFFGGRERPLHHTTLYRGIKWGRYPAQIHIGPQTVRWLRSECIAARQRMINERDGKTELLAQIQQDGADT